MNNIRRISACSSMLLATLLVSLLLLLAGSGCNRAGQSDKTGETEPAPLQGAQSAQSSASLVNQGDVSGGAEAQPKTDQDGDTDAAEGTGGTEGNENAEEDQQGEGGDESAGNDEGGDESAGGDEGNGGDEGGEETGPGGEDQPPETGDEKADDNGGGEDEMPRQPNPDIDAAAIYRSARCGQCHSDDYRGTPSGPPLLDMADYWNADDLADFLRSPMTYSETNQRLIDMGRSYPVLMPPTHRSDDELFALAWWLLELEDGSGEEAGQE